MKTLIEAVEAWIDDRITNNIAVDRADRMSHSATVDIQDWDAKFKEIEQIHIRDANRSEELERWIVILDGDSPPIGRESATDLSARLDHQEQRIDLWIDEGDTSRLDSVDSRLDDLECSMDEKVDSSDVDDKIDSSDVDDKIESALADLDLPDSYSVEVMIDDALETKVMDAVRAELDATDFKITVER